MKSFLTEQIKMINKSNNFSKSNLTKKIRNIKLINDYSQKRVNHTHKINLKLKNCYKYDFNNILNRNYNSNKNRIKRTELSYSSFYSKTTNFLDSDIFSPNFNSPNKINTDKLYKRIFSAKTNFTDDRIKSSTTQKTQSGKITNNSNKRKNMNNLYLKLKEKNIEFNKEYYEHALKKKKKENLYNFLKNSKLVRKEKFINNFLDNKLKYEKEMLEEKYNKIQITEHSNKRYLFLLKQYGFTFDKYLDKIFIKKYKESHLNDEYKEKILELENEIEKINKEINKEKNKLLKMIRIKELIHFVGCNEIKENKSRNISNLLLLKKNLEERINLTYDVILSKYNNKKISKSMIQNLKQNIELNKSSVRRTSKRYHSKVTKSNNKNKNFIKIKTTNNIIPSIINKKKKQSLKIENECKNNTLENLDEFKESFNKFEIIILSDLEYFTKLIKEISYLKRNLYSNELKETENKQISQKINLLNFQKNKNKFLINQLNLIKNTYVKKININKKLYKKLYNILISINEENYFQEKLDLQNVFKNLNKDTREYYKHIKISKSLYIIKTLERIYLFHAEIKRRYFDDAKLKEFYLKRLSTYKKEKEELNFKKCKEKIEKHKKEKEKSILKKTSKIYVTSHMKYNMKLYIKKKKSKNKIMPMSKNEERFDEMLTYY